MPIVDARVIVLWATPAGSAVNTIDARYDDAVNTPQQVADTIRDGVESTFLQFLSSEVALTEVQVGDDISGAIAPGSASGGDSDSVTNPSVAYGIAKVVGTGRSGRWFLPGVTENGVDGSGQIGAAKRAALQTEFTAFLAAAEAGGVDFRVKQKDGSYQQIDSFNVRPFITLQSRRLDRVRG